MKEKIFIGIMFSICTTVFVLRMAQGEHQEYIIKNGCLYHQTQTYSGVFMETTSKKLSCDSTEFAELKTKKDAI